MTFFDLVVLVLLLVSGLVGFVRGFTRELVTVGAFLGGALAALFTLRFSRPLGRAVIDPDWAGDVSAFLIVFLLVYILLRILGARLHLSVRKIGALSSIDRAAGVGIGLVRALVLIGVFHLVLHTATPEERLPTWMTGAASYPLSSAAAAGLRVVAREGAENADGLGPAIRGAVADTEPEPDLGPEEPAR
ncbi:MAG: CvpA family protein [Pseudomonadota bacterium]|nr:CvpA family protein [Pseudomonadota bacterium]